MPEPRVVIVGGGYSGVCVAVQLAQQSPLPLDITVIEPEPEVGRGVAYGSTDPDHRLNGPAVVHHIYANWAAIWASSSTRTAGTTRQALAYGTYKRPPNP
jgi:glycine/D-amino acid oxidase-like deaminating enzyme